MTVSGSEPPPSTFCLLFARHGLSLFNASFFRIKTPYRIYRMLYSALAYLLSGLLALTLVSFLGTVVKMLLFLIVSRLVGQERLLRNPGSIMRPIDFVSGIAQGWLALWLAGLVFAWLVVPVDMFLPLFLAVAFFWFDWQNLRRQQAAFERGDVPPQVAFLPQEMQERFYAMLYNSAVIGIMGKITGVATAFFNG